MFGSFRQHLRVLKFKMFVTPLEHHCFPNLKSSWSLVFFPSPFLARGNVSTPGVGTGVKPTASG